MCPWKSHHDHFWKCWYLLPLILRKESWMEELLSTRQFKISIWRNSSHALPTGKIKAYNIPNIAESALYWQVDGIFSARGCHRCSGNSDHAWTLHWLGIQPGSWQKWSRCNGRTGHSTAHVSRMPCAQGENKAGFSWESHLRSSTKDMLQINSELGNAEAEELWSWALEKWYAVSD